MDNNYFGIYLKQLREKKNLTLRNVETQSEVSDSYLSQIETGQRGIPHPNTLKKLAPVYDVSYEHLMREAGYLEDINSDEFLREILPKTYEILQEVNYDNDEKIANMIKVFLEEVK